MTRRAWFVLGLALVSLAGGLVTGRDLFYNLVYVWGGLFVAAFVWARLSLRKLVFRRTLATSRAQVGHVLEEHFSLTNNSRLPKLFVSVRDRSKIPGYRATSLTGLGLMGPSDRIGHLGSSVIGGLRSGHTERWQVRTVCTQRGRYLLGPTELESGDPFGLFSRVVTVATNQHVVVLPGIFPVRGFELARGRRPGGEALRRRTHQVTPNAASVRDYEPGDSLNRIHWRSTAKRDRLMVKEFELDPLADVWLVLDGAEDRQFRASTSEEGEQLSEAGSNGLRSRRLHLEPDSQEYMVAIAASLTFHLLHAERDVGLIAHGQVRHAIQPERGHAQLQRLLESLAVLQASGDHHIDEVMKIEFEQIPRGAAVILITTDVTSGLMSATSDLARRGNPPITILIDPAGFGGPPGAASQVRQLERIGSNVHLIQRGDDMAGAFTFDRPIARRRVA